MLSGTELRKRFISQHTPMWPKSGIFCQCNKLESEQTSAFGVYRMAVIKEKYHKIGTELPEKQEDTLHGLSYVSFLSSCSGDWVKPGHERLTVLPWGLPKQASPKLRSPPHPFSPSASRILLFIQRSHLATNYGEGVKVNSGKDFGSCQCTDIYLNNNSNNTGFWLQ